MNSSPIDFHDNTSLKYTNNKASYVVDTDFKIPDNVTRGRVHMNVNDGENGTPLYIQEMIPKNERTNYSNAMRYDHPDNLLSKTYFSIDNIEIIQNGIRAGVYRMSNKKHIIDRQDYDTIKIIMRSIYIQYSLNKDTDIQSQVRDLNQRVLDYCVPRVYNELTSYLKYKHDITNLAVPIDAPVLMGTDNSMELKNFF